nr:hypothetical protein BaRGS_014433 [Batillaria attramentaria]
MIECLCSCSPNNRPQNVSLELLLEAVQREIKKTQEDLLLDTSNLSATIRRKTSAKDSRPAAQATGAIGIVMLVVVFGSIILPDLVSVVHAVVKAIRNFIRDKGNKPQ